MNKFPFIGPGRANDLFRIAVSLFLIAHGVARIYLGTVDGFGEFLNASGFVIGRPLAWGITIFEIAGGTAMIFRYFVRWIASIFILELFVGIILVHAKNGWFVVGATLGGMEYSVLLIVSLIVIAAQENHR